MVGELGGGPQGAGEGSGPGGEPGGSGAPARRDFGVATKEGLRDILRRRWRRDAPPGHPVASVRVRRKSRYVHVDVFASSSRSYARLYTNNSRLYSALFDCLWERGVKFTMRTNRVYTYIYVDDPGLAVEVAVEAAMRVGGKAPVVAELHDGTRFLLSESRG